MKIYVAGKITGLDRSESEKKFLKAKVKLVKAGHSVFIPTVLPVYEDVTHENYLHICYSMIDVCDAVYILDNWQNSIGARKELQYASDWGKEIIYEDSYAFPIVYTPPKKLPDYFGPLVMSGTFFIFFSQSQKKFFGCLIAAVLFNVFYEASSRTCLRFDVRVL